MFKFIFFKVLYLINVVIAKLKGVGSALWNVWAHFMEFHDGITGKCGW